MTKDELWKIYVRKNPRLLTRPVTFTPRGIKQFFDETWEQGRKHGESDPLGIITARHNTGGS